MRAKLVRGSGGIARWTLASVAVGLLIVASGSGQAMLLATILAEALSDMTATSVTPLLLGLGGILVLRAVLIWLAELVAQACAKAVKTDLRKRLFSHLLILGPGVTLVRQTGELQATIVGGVEALECYYSRYVPAVAIAIIGCTGVVIVIAALDWVSALLLAFFLLAFPIVDEAWMRWRMPKGSGVFAAMGAFAAYLLDSLQGIVTIKAFGAADARRSVLATKATALRQQAMATLRVSLLRGGLTGFVMLSGIGLLVVVNVLRVDSGNLAPHVLLVTFFLAPEAFRPLSRVEKEFHTAWAARGAIAPIESFLALSPAVIEPPRSVDKPSTGDVAFTDVSFTYPQSAGPALASLSFHVREKEFVALVGASGAGKSTVMALLLRFFDPSSGRIYVGGVDVRDLSLKDLHSLVSVVSQDTFLFRGTIADNLRFGKPEATDDDLRAAARAVHIAEFIECLPQGYDTEIGERGMHLSGGQRQRLSIARALLKDAPILILDEATSNVDAQSEKAIQAALKAVAGKRTMLVIAHRLSTIARADRILVLDGGRLVETGTPAELGRSGGAYGTLLAAEMEGLSQ
ncbi:ABC transporter ATP-binding protein [Pararhizobium sp. LjRoot255]|uniref:ABC transporter ATP-binding protein/permease n=1 Tax=Pararhizobium sp. LjRoot255 TaxID=3342298 RepID=UPI003ED17469